ncbi:MAG: hypothetical protein ABR586_10250 [Thermoplasmatota archaeon]
MTRQEPTRPSPIRARPATAALAFSALLLVAAFAIAPAHADPLDDAALAACEAQISATRAAFDAYPNNVPAPVAAAGFQSIYQSCYRPDPGQPANAQIIDMDGMDAICSGGGTTLLGWANSVWILGKKYHIANQPASSYVSWVKNPNNPDRPLREGHVRSVVDDMEFTIVDQDTINPRVAQTWSFANVPMNPTMGVWSHCEGPLVTSSTTGAFGYPIGLDILQFITGTGGSTLLVHSDGTTCFVPC